MKILLDTCTFIWIVSDPAKLSVRVQQVFSHGEHEFFLSVLSLWEIMILYQINKLGFADDPEKTIERACNTYAIEVLFLYPAAIFVLRDLPFHHKDPFDRMLICQAKAHTMPILTPDPLIQQYRIETIW